MRDRHLKFHEDRDNLDIGLGACGDTRPAIRGALEVALEIRTVVGLRSDGRRGEPIGMLS